MLEAIEVAEQDQVQEIVATLLACLDTRDPSARLACYDREARAAKGAIAAREVGVLDRAEVRRTRRSLFGFSVPSVIMRR